MVQLTGGWVQKLLGRARNSSYLRHNIIYFSGSFGISVLNYLYYPVLGRLMVPANFGEVQTIISFFLQAAVFLQVLGLISIGIIRKYDDEGQRDRLVQEFFRISFYIGVAATVLLIIGASWLRGYFHFNSAAPFIALALSLLVSVPGAFANSFLQGHHRFGALARSGLISAGGKLIFSTILVLLGWQAFGAIFGIVLAQSLALVYALSRSRGGFNFLRTGLAIRKPNFNLIKPELGYAALALSATLTINVLLSLDVLVIKHLFNPTQAGLYAGISTIGRIVFFITGPLAIVLMPSVKPGRVSHNRQLLVRSLALSLLLGGGSLLVFSLAPKLVITILLGAKYLTYANLLPRLSAAIFLLSVGNLLVYYSVASRYYLAALFAPASLLLGAILIQMFHANFVAIINDLIIAAVVLILLLAVRILWPASSSTKEATS